MSFPHSSEDGQRSLIVAFPGHTQHFCTSVRHIKMICHENGPYPYIKVMVTIQDQTHYPSVTCTSHSEFSYQLVQVCNITSGCVGSMNKIHACSPRARSQANV